MATLQFFSIGSNKPEHGDKPTPFHFRNGRVTVVSLLKPPCGGFGSETVTWIQKWFK
jgi:hypothetical protein